MKNKVSKLNKHIYNSKSNPFAGATVVNFKRVLTYPNEGSVRFQIQMDKNNRIYDIRRSYATTIKDPETKKRYVKITLGERPRSLYNRIKGRLLINATFWIDDYIVGSEIGGPEDIQSPGTDQLED